MREAKCPQNLTTSPILKLVEIANLQIQLRNTIDLPVPFQYFHLLNLMVFMALLFWAYELAITQHLGAPLLFCVFELVFIGMLDIAVLMSTPFEHDTLDFDIVNWVYASFSATLSIVEYDFVGSHDSWKQILSQEIAPNIDRMQYADWAQSPNSKAKNGAVLEQRGESEVNTDASAFHVELVNHTDPTPNGKDATSLSTADMCMLRR
jgi:hypothetical protein